MCYLNCSIHVGRYAVLTLPSRARKNFHKLSPVVYDYRKTVSCPFLRTDDPGKLPKKFVQKTRVFQGVISANPGYTCPCQQPGRCEEVRRSRVGKDAFVFFNNSL